MLLYLVSQATTFGSVYFLLLAYCLCYFPTIALTNSLTLRNITNAADAVSVDSGVWDLGWIVIGLVVGFMKIEASATPFLLAAGFSVVMGLYSLRCRTRRPQRKVSRHPGVRFSAWTHW